MNSLFFVYFIRCKSSVLHREENQSSDVIGNSDNLLDWMRSKV
mgnify:FL=1